MVKGISRQVILVHGPDPKLFEQAIFILKDSAVSDGVSEDALVKEAEKIIRLNPSHSHGEMLEALRRNADVSLSTISYNLSTNIAVIWAHHSKLPINELKKAIVRIAKLLPYMFQFIIGFMQ